MIGRDLALALRKFEHHYLELKPPLTLVQLIVLDTLREGPMKSSEAASASGLSYDVGRDVIHRMKKRGFILRIKNGRLTGLTQEGANAVDQSKAMALRIEESLLRGQPRAAPYFKDALRAMTT